MAISQFMDQIGDWNPQLLRELKGRLTLRNLTITLCLSFGCQWLISKFFASPYNTTFRVLQQLLPPLLVVVGSYLLSNDLSKEYRQRTIEFIRLTPQSSQEILIGKLLGVPILVYVAILAALPLHFISYWQQTHSLIFLGFYLFWILQAWLFYSLGLIYTLILLKQRRHNYPAAMIAGSVAFITFILERYVTTCIDFLIRMSSYENEWFDLKWYGLSLNQSYLLLLASVIFLFIIVGHFSWQVLNRQFQNSQATLITKKQSYQVTLLGNLFLLGFIIHSSFATEFAFIWLFGVLPILSLGSIILLFPSHQYLLDWSRYGHFNRNKGFWKDLVWGEKSPPIITVFINALMTTLIWIGFLLLEPSSLLEPYSMFDSYTKLSILKLLLLPIMTISIILIYAMVTQILMLNSSSKAKGLTIAVMATLTILFPLMAFLLKVPSLWLFSLLPVIALYQGSTVAYFIGLGLQLVILGLLTAKLRQQIYLAGASETQPLF
ncbi:MAG: hypothetical protein AB4058_06005 [Microcystaceae cyanobacterium]